ncbi:hypothetical protein [Rhodococcoides kyotonense]|uniref:Uncharacterized protein n=1 Tax=Rhodococcoides kyotonense TaxID=398843 RepID=A0A239LHS7_9NOCA|nr:hypothetical protein [Rhodococcus kyotonensis]SNT29219.1 hypothetical protein SAMN05421642_11317 [Rhodococcus kyotonensis]
MLEQWKRQRAAKRLQPGDGRALQPFRWWQLPGRALFHLSLRETYAVDVRHWQNQSSGEVKANLYQDGRHVAQSKLPAAFPVESGTVEVAMSGSGVKRCHYIADDGTEHQLRPDPASAEGRRARLEQNHPATSRLIGIVSVAMLVVGVALLILQVAEPISRIPPIADSIGTFTSPIDLPLWLNIALGAGAVIGSVERSLRLRYHWLLDAVGT